MENNFKPKIHVHLELHQTTDFWGYGTIQCAKKTAENAFKQAIYEIFLVQRRQKYSTNVPHWQKKMFLLCLDLHFIEGSIEIICYSFL